MMTNSFYGLTQEESAGLYGNGVTFGGTYFQWLIFYPSATQPATPTGGSWNFQSNSGIPPTGWLANPPTAPVAEVWVSVGVVSSTLTTPISWSTPGLMTIPNSTIFGTMAYQNANSVTITGGTLNGAEIGGGTF